MRLRGKLICVFLAFATALVAVLTLTNYRIYKLGIRKHMTLTLTEISNKTNTIMDQYLKELIYLSKTPLYDLDNASVERQMRFITVKESDMPDWMKTSVLEEYIDVKFLLPRQDIVGVHLWYKDGLRIDRYRNGKIPYEYRQDPTMLSAMEQAQGAFVLSGIQMQPAAGGQDGVSVFSVYRMLNRFEKNAPVASLIFDISLDRIRIICSDTSFDQGSKVMVVDRNGRIVYSPIASEIGSTYEAGYEHDRLLGTSVSAYSGWTIVTSMPMEAVANESQWILNSLLVVSASSLLVAIGLSALLLNQIVKPLKRLQALMRKAELGQFELRYHARSKDELSYLGNSFNRMLERIQSLINERYVSELRQKEAEFKALQSQIHPHFLFNSLESIRMVAEIEDNPKVADMIASLGALMLENLRQKKNVTVKEELDYIRHYLHLKSFRLSSPLRTVIACDPKLEGQTMPPLLVQPLVENAIIHGFKGMKQDSLLEIDIRPISCERYTIAVRDNGSGIDADRLAVLQASIQRELDSGSKTGSIGLWNVNQRIKHYYGEQYGLRVQSFAGQGSTFELELPIMGEIGQRGECS